MSASVGRRSQLQKQVLSLYKQMLRAAEEKPGFTGAIKTQVSLVFRPKSFRWTRQKRLGFPLLFLKILGKVENSLTNCFLTPMISKILT